MHVHLLLFPSSWISYVNRDCRAILLRSLPRRGDNSVDADVESGPTENTTSTPCIAGKPLTGTVYQALCDTFQYSPQTLGLDNSLMVYDKIRCEYVADSAVMDARAAVTATPKIYDSSGMLLPQVLLQLLSLVLIAESDETTVIIETASQETNSTSLRSFSGSSRPPLLKAVALTVDHTLQSFIENEAVRQSTTDPNPFRQSRNDRTSIRVAGTLAVSRALGDAYLKMREYSAAPFAEHCPYISCIPTISVRRITAADAFVVLASGTTT
jgi:hypothetical protein